jgi:MarR family transcriptional regulator, lower aerobic nicotinate degradation pathway regulator
MSVTAPEIKHKVPKELLASPGFLLARLGIAIKTKALGRFEEAGFDGYHYSVLAFLGEGSSETQGSIADALGLDPSQLVGILDSLEERGLVERHRDPLDRRRHAVSVTAEGKKQLQRLRAIRRQTEEEFFAPLDAESRERLHELLLRLACYHDPRCGGGDVPPTSS